MGSTGFVVGLVVGAIKVLMCGCPATRTNDLGTVSSIALILLENEIKNPSLELLHVCRILLMFFQSDLVFSTVMYRVF